MNDVKKQIVDYFYCIDNKLKFSIILKYFTMYLNIDNIKTTINKFNIDMVCSNHFNGYICRIETLTFSDTDYLFSNKDYYEYELNDTFVTNIVLHSKDEIQKNLNDMRGQLIKLEHDINKYDNLLKLI